MLVNQDGSNRVRQSIHDVQQSNCVRTSYDFMKIGFRSTHDDPLRRIFRLCSDQYVVLSKHTVISESERPIWIPLCICVLSNLGNSRGLIPTKIKYLHRYLRIFLLVTFHYMSLKSMIEEIFGAMQAVISSKRCHKSTGFPWLFMVLKQALTV